jgi:hypothetical protein
VAPQIIYITTLPSTGKRPRVLKHAHTFPPDPKSSPKTISLAQSLAPAVAAKASRKRSTSSITERSERVSRKRAAPSETLQPERQVPERVTKRVKRVTGALPISPPDTPDKTSEQQLMSLSEKSTGEKPIPETQILMSPPSSPLLHKSQESTTTSVGKLPTPPGPSEAWDRSSHGSE